MVRAWVQFPAPGAGNTFCLVGLERDLSLCKYSQLSGDTDVASLKNTLWGSEVVVETPYEMRCVEGRVKSAVTALPTVAMNLLLHWSASKATRSMMKWFSRSRFCRVTSNLWPYTYRLSEPCHLAQSVGADRYLLTWLGLMCFSATVTFLVKFLMVMFVTLDDMT